MKNMIISRSAEETTGLGQEIAAEIRGGGIVCLYGDLGSGKTTFTQGLAKALGIERTVNSPTFLVIRKYESRINDRESRKDLYHIDLYRLESEREMEEIGLREILENPENIVVIEWAEKLKALLPKKRIEVRFDYVDDDTRNIILHEYE